MQSQQSATTGSPEPEPSEPQSPAVDRALVEAFVRASRVLVAVAARSLAGLDDDITLAQYRALVVLASRGPQRALDLSLALNVTPGTGSRMIERLVRRDLVRRDRSRDDRRAVSVHLTEQGRQVVARVTEARSAEIARLLEAMPGEDRVRLIAALSAFADAAGEVSEQDWALGWAT